MKKILASFLLIAVAVAIAPQTAQAVNPINDGYNNKIIDDNVFLNSGTMSVQDIQNFLIIKEPNCGNGLCLRAYSEGGRSAAQIIYDSTVPIGLNPRVILSTLQKEQSLITNQAPSQSAINFAMGYGCPEGPGCDPAYIGFNNQVSLGSRLLRAGAARNCGDNNTLPGWNTNAKWHAGNTLAVDGRDTYMGSCATGSLYNYTPHRPDSAYRGATNGTLYYGNYNFIKNYTAWFGSTWSNPYQAAYIGQTNIQVLPKGQAQQVTVTYRNVGTTTWAQNVVRLGTANPLDRPSGFAGGAGWISNNRVQMQESSVAPGANAHFVFNLTGNSNVDAHDYKEYFRPVADGFGWMVDVGQHFPFTVVNNVYEAQVQSVSAPNMLNANNQGTVTVRYRNLGAATWFRDGSNPFRLGTDNPHDRVSVLYSGSPWVSNNRIKLQEVSVPPFGVGTFSFPVTTSSVGRFTERFTPVIDGVTWFDDPINLSIESGGTYAADWAGQSAYPQILPGQTATVYIDYKNTGTATWYNDGPYAVHLGTDNQQDRNSPLANGSWLGPNRPANLTQATVAPGQTGRFSFTATGPSAANYHEYFRPVAEGRTWFGLPNNVYIDVNTIPHYSAAWAGQSPPAALSGSSEQTAWIEFRNTGNTTWQKSGANPIRLGTSNPLDRQSIFAGTDGWLSPNRIELDQSSVAPGGVGRFTFSIKNTAGKPAGTYHEDFRPVIDGVGWLNWGVWLPFVVQ
ncbi:hypothetical protein EXS54_03155 [Patescibacteria group bacterium]|nr:hypothetical protein [Patescibacteria group bacterium]